MKKEEYITKYGLEWYEQYKEVVNIRCKARYYNDPKYRAHRMERKKERYHNDPEFREAEKIRKKARYRYVENKRIDLIENYGLAVNDGIENWDIHHRLELHPDGSIRFTRQSLIKLGLYYNRPPTELIWIKRSEHIQMHSKSRGLK